MTDEISSAKEVSVVQFRNAVRIAQGISTEETALKMTTALKEASSNLTKANSAALSDSVQKIYDSAQTSSGSIEDMMASIDSVCNTIDTMHKREAETADILLGRDRQVQGRDRVHARSASSRPNWPTIRRPP
jgi:uncharacterized protein YaaN involved in tellurite resistance